ncbi:hypothetical protein H9645_06450 [Luteimonas sp. Sa2BVA3]|uniref:Uncharacterized protein n=1 Tax=Luteimonas colneyensis TaxID=2762230 RepID=A0ABR8UI43_9GAMM|nr:hypothetical protein [Luteimonas colneyensis]
MLRVFVALWLATAPVMVQAEAGPRQSVPWLTGEDAGFNDAVAAGSFEEIGAGPRLLTPLQPES